MIPSLGRDLCFAYFSRYNVVPTHARFHINMPVLTSKKHSKTPYGTTTETKKKQKNKIQNLSEGPKTFGLFGVPSVFWFRLNETIAFLDFWWKTTKTRVFWFFGWVSSENTKQTLCFFGFLLENQKKPLGTPQNPKVSGPSHRLLNFWFFGGNPKTQNPKPF